jgi:hypothetical protein
VRSSSFNSEAGTVSPARRFFLKPEDYRPDLGFRCVVEAPVVYAPFCEQVYIPGYPENDQNDGTSSRDCPVPEFTTYLGECADQKAQIGNGSVIITGGEIVSVVAPDCVEAIPGTWFCTGPQGSSVSLTACLACDAEDEDGPSGVDCPPGTYDNGGGQCVGRDDSVLCPNGYLFDASNQCCTAEPGIPYPGCDPVGEYLTHLNTCEQGSPPLGDSCGVISVPLASCRQPDGGGGEPGSGDPCNQYPSETECYRYGSNMSCYWNGNVCVTE